MSKTKSVRQGKITTDNKKKKLYIGLTSVGLAIVAILSIVLPIVLRAKEFPFSIPALSVPVEDEYALNKYTYEQLDDVKITVRADTMNVTKRNLPRITPQMLSDDFSLVYDKDENRLFPYYGDFNPTSSNQKVAKISFNPNNYPEPYYKKGSKATGVYTQAAAAAGVSEADYYSYYKYMFMTQGQHLAKEASWRSALTASESDEINAEFAAWLRKHPAADGQYGAVVGENNAVEKEITLDPIYRSLHTTGLYLPAGEPVTIKIEGLKPGERISVNLGSNSSMAWRGSVPNSSATIKEITGGRDYNQVGYQNTASDYFFKQADIVTAGGKFFENNTGDSTPFLQSQWKRQNARAAWLDCTFTFTENKTYTIGFAFGGLIQINMGNCYSQVKATITGAVETPHYILGVTTPDYFEEYLKNSPGVMAVLDTENGILTGPTGELGNPYLANMRTVKKDEIDKLAMLWHSFLSVNESFTGGTYNRFNKVHFDWHVPAGAAVSLGNYTFAQPTSWFSAAMNYRGLLASGTWGTLHEIGHNHASAYGSIWGFRTGQEGEVRNNALTVLSYIMFADVGTTIRMGGSAEHGMYANPYRVVNDMLANKGKMHDFNEAGYWHALEMYSNIMHSFGAEKYYELLYTYKLNSEYCSNPRADFAYRCATVYQMNFLSYFNDFYAANITEEMFTEDQLDLMKSFPNYNPVANFYAGGIDGVKTAGDYLVTFGDDITFDLMSTTVSALDTREEKGFEIISVENPVHGSIRNTDKNKWTYSFNKGYTGATDQFSFNVKLKDGVIHKLTIYLRIGYNGSRISQYTSLQDPGKGGREMFDSFSEQISQQQPQYLPTSTGASMTAYTTSNLEVRTADFWWKAPVTGEVALTIAGRAIRLYVGEDFEHLEGTDLIFSGNIGLSTNFKHVMQVEKDKYYAIRLMTTSRGNMGSRINGSVYVLQKDGQVLSTETLDNDKFNEFVADGAKYVIIPSSQVFHPEYPLGIEAETYIFEPNYIVSKKSGVKLSTSGTDKTMWDVLKAPEYIHEGRYDTEVQYVVRVDENGNEVLDANGDPVRDAYEINIDKWGYLIDGEEGTYLHTAYSGSYVPLSENNPHEFIIDTQKVQDINFFKVVTRNHSNSYIEDFELYLAGEMAEDGSFEWEMVAEGDRSNYVKNSITLKFETHHARYLRLVVKKTSGGRFSVVSEIDAGIDSPVQKLISLSSSKLFTADGWQSSTEIDTEPNGYLIANKANAKAVIRFKGESVALYARTDNDCGKINIIIDGVQVEVVDLYSSAREARKLVFYAENLDDKEHTMEIITMGSEKVVLNAIGIPYSASLLNAPNIYLERALTISLVVFVLLFVALAVLLICLLFLPKFRKLMGNNKAINWLDKKLEENKAKRQEKKLNKTSKDQKVAESKNKESKAGNKKEGKTNKKQVALNKTNKTQSKQETLPQQTKKPAKVEKTPSKPAKTNVAAKPTNVNTKTSKTTDVKKPVSNSKVQKGKSTPSKTIKKK